MQTYHNDYSTLLNKDFLSIGEIIVGLLQKHTRNGYFKKMSLLLQGQAMRIKHSLFQSCLCVVDSLNCPKEERKIKT